MPAGSREAGPPRIARTAPASSTSRPWAAAAWASHSWRVLGRRSCAAKYVPTGSPASAAAAWSARATTVGMPASVAIMAAAPLVALPPMPRVAPPPADACSAPPQAHPGEVGAALHPADLAGARPARIGVVEPVHIGEQDQRARPDHVRDERREPVVVAEPDLVGGDRVVLVD